MITINSIEIMDIFSLDYIFLRFSIEDTLENISSYQFNIHRSNSEHEGYELLASNVTGFSYSDYNVNLYNTAIHFYYKVECVNLITGDKSMSNICSEYKGRVRDCIAQGIISNYNMYLDNVLNTDEVYLLKKKRFGTRCSCFDDIRGKSKNSRCPICFSTKYVGGYYASEKMKICTSNSPAKTEKFDVTESSELVAPIQAWTSNSPLIEIGDIIVDSNNDRYVVASWQPTYKNYMLLKQVVDLQRLPKSDIGYNVLVK